MKTVIQPIPPDVFETAIRALSDYIIQDYRGRWIEHSHTSRSASVAFTDSSWLRIDDAAQRARCHSATLRREVRRGRLKAVRVGGRKSLRFRPEWIDEWLQKGIC